MRPTPVLVGASGTLNSDEAIQPPSIDKSATLEIVPLYNDYSVSPLSSTSHPGPEMIRAILQSVRAAAWAVCEAADKAVKLEHEQRTLREFDKAGRRALREFRRAVGSLKSDIMVFMVLLNAMENDTNPHGRSPYTRFIQRCVGGVRA